MAFRLLDRMDAEPDEIATIITAIGNHDESTAFPVNPVAAALTLPTRPTSGATASETQTCRGLTSHDRVNYSVKRSDVTVSREEIVLDIDIDTGFCPVMDYFEIFLNRMILCRKASEKLGIRFALIINGQKMI